MSREFKFRAWHESDGGIMLQVGDDYGTSHPLDCCRYKQDGQPVKLMQYTGLKDLNGVEIYEGDIVLTGACNSIPYVVEFTITQGQSRFTKRRHNEDKKYDIGLDCSDYMNVIGNIHENKELLETKP